MSAPYEIPVFRLHAPSPSNIQDRRALNSLLCLQKLYSSGLIEKHNSSPSSPQFKLMVQRANSAPAHPSNSTFSQALSFPANFPNAHTFRTYFLREKILQIPQCRNYAPDFSKMINHPSHHPSKKSTTATNQLVWIVWRLFYVLCLVLLLSNFLFLPLEYLIILDVNNNNNNNKHIDTVIIQYRVYGAINKK